MEFDFVFQYKPWKTNQVADALSCVGGVEHEAEHDAVHVVAMLTSITGDMIARIKEETT